MLTAVARASLRRVAVSLPLRPLTAPIARQTPAVVSAVRARPFSATPRAAEAAAKGTKKKALAKGKKAAPKKKTAVKKAAPKKKKKVLTPEEKLKAEVRELKKKALLKEPAKVPETSWQVYIVQELKGVSAGDGLASLTKAAGERFRALSSGELEVRQTPLAPASSHLLCLFLRHGGGRGLLLTTRSRKQSLQSAADSNRTANAASYKAWVQSHTPEQIHEANLSRARLARLAQKGATNAKAPRKIVDERLPKRPGNAYALFIKERWASGDVNGEVGAVGLELAREWKGLSESEKKVSSSPPACHLLYFPVSFLFVVVSDANSLGRNTRTGRRGIRRSTRRR